VSGALWAIAAGAGFGIFQALNRRAVHGMDAYLSTFFQLLISGVVLGAATVFTIDLSLVKSMSAQAWFNFSMAGFFHFFVGWTLLNSSQKRIGASRTSPLIGTTPLFGAMVGFVYFGEVLSISSWIGIFLIITGVYLVTRPGEKHNGDSQTPQEESSWRAYMFGIGAAMAWSISPIFIRKGLAEVPFPVLGVTIGMLASAIGYIVPLYLRRKQNVFGEITKDALAFKVIAATLVGFSTWARWNALELTAVATVLAITMISTPLVLIISPMVMGKQLEKITVPLVTGASLVLLGALILVLTP